VLVLSAALLAFLVVAVHLAAAFYLAESFTRSKRRRVQGTPADLGLRYEEIQFLTADRMVLHGWFLESPGARATVVLIHDLEGTRADREQGLLALQRDYVRRGFHVFAFDLRGRGESSGRRDHLGQAERLDVQAAVAYVRRRSGSLPVVLHGFGFGASLAVAAAGRGIDVSCVIADSPCCSMRAYLRSRHPHVPRYLFNLAAGLARRVFKADMEALTPIDVVDRATVPILFIHAEGDPEVPCVQTLNLAAASLNPRDELWVVPDALHHCAHYLTAPDAYVRRCLAFIDEAVPARILQAAAV
jgi:alpha-beta hydrolase superfamily lysophospholipase